MTAQRFRKKPVVIEAEQFIPDQPIPDGMKLWPDENGVQPRDMSFGFIETLEGRMHVQAGDWIITGVKGEKYPCKPDIFKATYEAVDTIYGTPEQRLEAIPRLADGQLRLIELQQVESAALQAQHLSDTDLIQMKSLLIEEQAAEIRRLREALQGIQEASTGAVVGWDAEEQYQSWETKVFKRISESATEALKPKD